MMPTFIMMSMKQLSGATNERKNFPASLKRSPIVRPAWITRASIASSPVRSNQRFQVDQKTKPRSWTFVSCCRSSISRE